MKKFGLFKTLLILIGVILLCSWIIPASYHDGSAIVDIGRYRVGFFDLFQFLFYTFQFGSFIQILIFILAVGGFYGVLRKTGKYRVMVEKFANKLKGKEKIFLIAVSFIFAAISSVLGFNLLLFIFIPFICGVILVLGYDKITAILTTCMSALIGIIGSTYGYYTLGIINETLSTSYSTLIYSKIALFLITFVVFMLFTLKRAEKKKVSDSKKMTDENKLMIEKLLGESKPIRKSSWPIWMVFGILFVMLILGCTAWSKTFEISTFTNLATTIKEATIGGQTIFAYILGNISELGLWYYSEMGVLCILGSLLIGLIYKVKFDEIIKGFLEGMSKVALPALLVVFAFASIYICANMPFINTIIASLISFIPKHTITYVTIVFILAVLGLIFAVDFVLIKKANLKVKKVVGYTAGVVIAFLIIYTTFKLSFLSTFITSIAASTKEFSVLMTSIASAINSLLYVDLTYAVYSLPIVTSTFDGSNAANILVLVTQAIHGIVMFVAPTSTMLILGTTFLNVSYKKWLKAIWKLSLILLSIILVILIITYYLNV